MPEETNINQGLNEELDPAIEADWDLELEEEHLLMLNLGFDINKEDFDELIDFSAEDTHEYLKPHYGSAVPADKRDDDEIVKDYKARLTQMMTTEERKSTLMEDDIYDGIAEEESYLHAQLKETENPPSELIHNILWKHIVSYTLYNAEALWEEEMEGELWEEEEAENDEAD
jgi:hypothetical protein